MSPPKVDREGEVVEREVVEREEGGKEEEEVEVKRTKVGGEEGGEGKEEREMVEREEVVSEFTSFDYRGTNYTDFAESKAMWHCVMMCVSVLPTTLCIESSHQPVVFQPQSTNSRDRGGGGLRSKVHMKSGERSHTYSSRQSKCVCVCVCHYMVPILLPHLASPHPPLPLPPPTSTGNLICGRENSEHKLP